MSVSTAVGAQLYFQAVALMTRKVGKKTLNIVGNVVVKMMAGTEVQNYNHIRYSLSIGRAFHVMLQQDCNSMITCTFGSLIPKKAMIDYFVVPVMFRI